MEISVRLEGKLIEVNVKQNLLGSKNYDVPEQSEDSIDLKDLWGAVDSIFDLGDSNIFSWLKLTKEEQSKFWEVVSKLIKAGIIGYRYYEVNGRLERHFIEFEMANPLLSNAKVKLFDKGQYSREWFV